MRCCAGPRLRLTKWRSHVSTALWALHQLTGWCLLLFLSLGKRSPSRNHTVAALEGTASFLHSVLKLLFIPRAMMSFLWDPKYQSHKQELSQNDERVNDLVGGRFLPHKWPFLDMSEPSLLFPMLQTLPSCYPVFRLLSEMEGYDLKVRKSKAYGDWSPNRQEKYIFF